MKTLPLLLEKIIFNLKINKIFLKIRNSKRKKYNKINGETESLSIIKTNKMTNKINAQIFYPNLNLLKIKSKKELNMKISKYFMIAFLSFFMRKITCKYFFKLQWTL